MAPRNNKRANNTPAVLALQDGSAPTPKKPRVDSKLAGIVATLQNAEHLNEHCREMLIAMTLGLATPKSERHPSQVLGVAMIEETLQDARAKFEEDVSASLDELSNLEASNSTRLAAMEDTEAALKETQIAHNASQSALDEAKQAVVNAENALSEAKGLQVKSDQSSAVLEEEKRALETVFQEHLIAPMDADKAPQYNFLQPFVNKLDLEESLKLALPSSCVKTKEQRGGFDDLVISELLKSYNAKIAAVTKSLEEMAPAVSENRAAVVAAEASLEEKRGVEQTAATELEAAKVAQVAAEGEVRKAKEEWAVLEPQFKTAVDKHSSLKAILDDYTTGTLATFQSLRDKVPVEEVAPAAPAGA